ncbi:MAG: 30S ribosomal protein S2 [Patescibacteria group bacterium]|nr:30S ribosomal protein S2 [Patescibacteria group bacterium]
MPQVPSILELLQAGVHFGHKSSRWHPKMQPFIFGARNGIHVIDLEKTQVKLQQAMDFVRDTVARGGVVLFLGTKRQARDIVKKYAEECGMPYVIGRWLGGTLTNFTEIMAVIRRYNDLKAQQATGGLAKYTKKEQIKFAKEIVEMEEKVGGVQKITRPPEAMFIIDLKKEKTALDEARERHIPVIALTDTNTNPDEIAYPIPSNDDAVKTIELMTKLMAEAVKEGQAVRARQTAEAEKAAPPVRVA